MDRGKYHNISGKKVARLPFREGVKAILVKALVILVHYGKHCTRDVSRGQVQHEVKPSAVVAPETCPSTVLTTIYHSLMKEGPLQWDTF